MNQEEIDKLVEARINEMIKENSTKMLSYFVSACGEKCIAGNVGTLELSVDHDVNGKRYTTTTVITTKEAL